MRESGSVPAANVRDWIARVSIWSFFLLIFVPTTQFVAAKHFAPMKPSAIYLVIAGVLLVSGIAAARPIVLPRADRAPLVLLVLLAVWGVVMYRGDALIPEAGIKLMAADAKWPSNASYVVYPVLNMMAAVGLYLLSVDYKKTITTAAIAALALQIAAMIADMIYPGVFGIDNGRAAGFAINPNPGAFLVAFLACTLLPWTRSRPHPLSIYGLLIAGVAVALTGSRGGAIAMMIPLGVWAWLTFRSRSFRLPSPAFLVAGALGLGALVALSPALNPSKEMRERIAFEREREAAFKRLMENETRPAHLVPMDTLPKRNYEGDAVNPTRPIESLWSRIASAFSFDLSASLRWKTFRDYSRLAIEKPMGRGTGYTNMYEDGPHNTFLKLAVDEGIAAAFGYLLLLALSAMRAIKERSPGFMAVVAICWVNSLMTHNALAEPMVLTMAFLALGLSSRASTNQRILMPVSPTLSNVPGQHGWKPTNIMASRR